MVDVSNPMTVGCRAVESMTKRIVATLAALAIALTGVAWSGCGGSDAEDEAQDQIDQVQEQVKKETEDAGEEAQEQIDKAQEQVEKKTEDAGEEAQEQIDKAQKQAGY
jgi:type VI protein secretion system component VasK